MDKKNKNLLIWGIVSGVVAVVIIIVLVIVLNQPPKGDNNGDNTGQTTNVLDGKFVYEGISFVLPSEYERIAEDFFQFYDDNNGIRVDLYYKKDFEGMLIDYVKKDEQGFHPVQSTQEEKSLNGHTWYKYKGNDGDYMYYAQDGKDMYMIAVSPLFAQASKVEELLSMLESSLAFNK